jgi:transcriptional regulator with XRE-family HTH domain
MLEDRKIKRTHRAITNFGKNMRQVRKLTNKSQKELASEGLSLHQLSDIENSYRDPRPDEAEKIANALDASVGCSLER